MMTECGLQATYLDCTVILFGSRARTDWAITHTLTSCWRGVSNKRRNALAETATVAIAWEPLLIRTESPGALTAHTSLTGDWVLLNEYAGGARYDAPPLPMSDFRARANEITCDLTEIFRRMERLIGTDPWAMDGARTVRVSAKFAARITIRTRTWAGKAHLGTELCMLSGNSSMLPETINLLGIVMGLLPYRALRTVFACIIPSLFNHTGIATNPRGNQAYPEISMQGRLVQAYTHKDCPPHSAYRSLNNHLS